MRILRTAAVIMVGLQAGCSGSGGGSADGGPGSDATDQDTAAGSNDGGGQQASDGNAVGDSSGGTGSSTCPPPQSAWLCPEIAPGGQCVVAGAPGAGCAPDAVPEGLPCGALQQCSMRILSCPGELEAGLGNGPVDGYICTCVSGHWSCDDCFPHDGPCSDAGQSTDAATGSIPDAGRGDAGFVSVLVLGRSNLCLGRSLPTGPSGESTCTAVIAGLAESCGAAGLSPATAQEVDAILASAPTTGGRPPGYVCELGQVPASTSGPGCSDPQSKSWCYTHGSCLGDAGTPCAEAICTTAAFQTDFIPVAPPDASFQVFSWSAYLLCP